MQSTGSWPVLSVMSVLAVLGVSTGIYNWVKVIRAAPRMPARRLLRMIAALNFVFVVLMGTMMVLTAWASWRHLNDLHGAAASGQLRDATDNSLIPPLLFGGGLVLVLLLSAFGVSFVAGRLPRDGA